jgi:hypothetical protein
MKTVKLVLVATLLVLASVSVTNADGFHRNPNIKVVDITLLKAMAIPGLPAIMLQQINQSSFLGCGCQASYTAHVYFNGVLYVISGSEREWEVFFRWGQTAIDYYRSSKQRDD